MNLPQSCDDQGMNPAVVSFLNCLSATVVVYATVTRGGKLVARLLQASFGR
jgi:hypothetical protein